MRDGGKMELDLLGLEVAVRGDYAHEWQKKERTGGILLEVVRLFGGF